MRPLELILQFIRNFDNKPADSSKDHRPNWVNFSFTSTSINDRYRLNSYEGRYDFKLAVARQHFGGLWMACYNSAEGWEIKTWN